MEQSKQSSPGILILVTFILLSVYNLLYWPGKISIGDSGILGNFYRAVKSHWGLFLLLEFLAVSSIFVDVIIRFDKLTDRSGKGQLVLTVVLFAAFVARIIFGLIDMYMIGHVQ